MAKTTPERIGASPEYLKSGDLTKLIPLSLSHIRDRVTRLPTFPKPLRVGNVRFWLADEVRAWLAKKGETA